MDTVVYTFPTLLTKPFLSSAFHASKVGLSVILDKNANILTNKYQQGTPWTLLLVSLEI